MSLDNVFETARKFLKKKVILIQPNSLQCMLEKATEMSEKMKSIPVVGEGEEVSDVPGMKGSEITADGTTPKVPEPVTGGTEPVDDLSDMEPEEEMYGSEEDMHGDDEEEMMNMDDDKKKK